MVLEIVAVRHLFRASASAAALFEVQIRCLNIDVDLELHALRRTVTLPSP